MSSAVPGTVFAEANTSGFSWMCGFFPKLHELLKCRNLKLHTHWTIWTVRLIFCKNLDVLSVLCNFCLEKHKKLKCAGAGDYKCVSTLLAGSKDQFIRLDFFSLFTTLPFLVSDMYEQHFKLQDVLGWSLVMRHKSADLLSAAPVNNVTWALQYLHCRHHMSAVKEQNLIWFLKAILVPFR